MPDNTDRKTTLKNPFTDKIFTVYFAAMLLTVIFGRKGMTGLAKLLGLGPGWPELLQGVFGFILMILVALRIIQLGKRARQP